MAALDYLRFFMAPPLTAATGGSDEEIMRSVMLTAGALAPAAFSAGAFDWDFPDDSAVIVRRHSIIRPG